jgi:hypothetical protein
VSGLSTVFGFLGVLMSGAGALLILDEFRRPTGYVNVNNDLFKL